MTQQFEIINLCPFDLCIQTEEEKLVNFPAYVPEAPSTPRTPNTLTKVFSLGTIPVCLLDESSNPIIPPPEAGKVFIVPAYIKRNYPNRHDLLCPGSPVYAGTSKTFNDIMYHRGLVIIV